MLYPRGEIVPASIDRYLAVRFDNPDQTLLLPESVETLRVIEGSSVPRLATTQKNSNFKRFTGSIKIVDEPEPEKKPGR